MTGGGAITPAVSRFLLRCASAVTARPIAADRIRSRSVLENRGDDHLPVVPIETVTGTLRSEELGTGNVRGQNLAMLEREHRVGGAVDDERRGSDRRQAVRRSVAVGYEVVVLHRGEVARPLEVTEEERTYSGLVECPLATRQGARVTDQVVDDGLAVRPVGFGRGDETTELRQWRREVVVAEGCGAGTDQGEREHPVSGVERDLL